jgi:hypothetical protein
MLLVQTMTREYETDTWSIGVKGAPRRRAIAHYGAESLKLSGNRKADARCSMLDAP